MERRLDKAAPTPSKGANHELIETQRGSLSASIGPCPTQSREGDRAELEQRLKTIGLLGGMSWE